MQLNGEIGPMYSKWHSEKLEHQAGQMQKETENGLTPLWKYNRELKNRKIKKIHHFTQKKGKKHAIQQNPFSNWQTEYKKSPKQH